RVHLVGAAAVIAIVVIATPGLADAQSAMPRVTVRIAASDAIVTVDAELAATADDRARGLMDRDSLLESAGMLFLFERDRGAMTGYYMDRTRVPQDIAYADREGRIVTILRMHPCTAERYRCPQYAPGVPYAMALETHAGFFAARGVRVGDRLTIEDGPDP